MEELGIVWEVMTVSVRDVDLGDNSYQTRLNVAERETSVSREYAEKMKNGEAFPMVVLQPKSESRFRVVAGRHRASGYSLAQNGKESYCAYVVAKDTPRHLLIALSARENNTNGVRQGNADTVRVAADELMKISLPDGARVHVPKVIGEMAEKFSVDRKYLRDRYFARRVEQEMLRVGVQPVHVPFSALKVLWKWTESEDWRRLASVVAAHASTPRMVKVIEDARRDRVDAAALVSRILELSESQSDVLRRVNAIKDPATVTMEHLSLALNDMRDLAPARNMSDEQAEDISGLVEAIRVACKEWKKR